MATAAAAQHAPTGPLQMIPPAACVPPVKNFKRHRFDQAALEELTASVTAKGVRIPIHVRPLDPVKLIGRDPTKAATERGPFYEIIAGERRWRAATAAGLTAIPAVVEDMNDHDARELQILENLHRLDLHPLDEAEAYRDLMALDPAYTVEAIAAKFGKSKRTIREMLKFASLVPTARDAFAADEITAGHAIRITKLPAESQEAALKACFYPLYGVTVQEDGKPVLAPIGELDRWMEKNTILDLKGTPAEEIADVFPELAQELATAATTGSVLLEVSSNYGSPTRGKGEPPVLPADKYTEIKAKKDRCATVQRGVVVYGGGKGRVFELCATPGCRKHFPAPKTPATSTMRQGYESDPNGVRQTLDRSPNRDGAKAERAARDKENKQREAAAAERKAWEAYEPLALKAFAAHVKMLKVTPALVQTIFSTISYGVGREVVQVIGKVTPKNLGQALAVGLVYEDTTTLTGATQAMKPFGFNVKKAFASYREQQRRVEAAKAAKPAAAKKTGTGRR
jgi:ParB/RepB/Spo0J family partition protein